MAANGGTAAERTNGNGAAFVFVVPRRPDNSAAGAPATRIPFEIDAVQGAEFTLRAADTPALVEIARVLVGEYAAMPHTTGRWPTAAADIAALPAPYVPPTGVLLIALDGPPTAPSCEQAALGCGALVALDPPAIGEIKRVYVRPGARRRGIGEALTRALLEWAATLGFERVRLDTAPELTAALALYERLGFTPIPPYKAGLLPDALCFERAVDR